MLSMVVERRRVGEQWARGHGAPACMGRNAGTSADTMAAVPTTRPAATVARLYMAIQAATTDVIKTLKKAKHFCRAAQLYPASVSWRRNTLGGEATLANYSFQSQHKTDALWLERTYEKSHTVTPLFCAHRSGYSCHGNRGSSLKSQLSPLFVRLLSEYGV